MFFQTETDSFLFLHSYMMYWTSEHDVLLSENPNKATKSTSQRSEMWNKIANTLKTWPKTIFPVDKRYVRDYVGILINRIKTKLESWGKELDRASRRPSPQNLKYWLKKLWLMQEQQQRQPLQLLASQQLMLRQQFNKTKLKLWWVCWTNLWTNKKPPS